MRSFKLFWSIHKWTGIIAAAIFAMTATTGFLLLLKKRVNWIQPPTHVDASAQEDGESLSTERLFEIVFAQAHADFSSIEDIDRVDFRPRQRVFKVHSRHHHSEMQVGAVSGEILSVRSRPSDLIESIHDGSFFAGWVHDWVMPLVAAALLMLILSGYWVWLFPILRRRRRRQRAESRRGAELPLT